MIVLCSVDGCERDAQSRGGWCRPHWKRWKRWGDPAYRFERPTYGPTCAIAGCLKPTFSRGWCRMHYGRWQRHDDPMYEALPVALAERFWQKVDKSGECWVWTAYCDTKGYGCFELDGQCLRAHRVAYMLARGPIPSGMDVRHDCDNPPCVRPSHLQLGDHAQNMLDKAARGRAHKGEAGTAHKLNADIVRAVRARHAAGGLTYKQVGALFGMSGTMVGYIVRRMSWAHVE